MLRLVHDLERQMKDAAKQLEFEKAALLRDQIVDIRKLMEEDRALSLGAFGRKERARR